MLKAEIKKENDQKHVEIRVQGNIVDVVEDVCLLVKNIKDSISGDAERLTLVTALSQVLFDIDNDSMFGILEKTFEEAAKKAVDNAGKNGDEGSEEG